MLKKHWDRPEVIDVLKDSFDLGSCASDVLIELNVYSTGLTDYSSFDYNSLYEIFNTKPEVTLKKSAIQQLSMLINDRSDNLGVSGRKLFREKKKGRDVFSLSVQELLTIYHQAEERGINRLHPNELNYMQELLRFLVLSFLFYFDEPVISELMKPYFEIDDTENFENSTLGHLIDALKQCLGSKQTEIRKHAFRCLQIILLQDQVKLSIDAHFSVPTYMTNAYEFLFPIVSFQKPNFYRNTTVTLY